MAPRRKRTTSSSVNPATGGKSMLHQVQEEQLPSSDVFTYWPANPVFHPKRVLLRRIFLHQRGQDQVRVCRFLPCTRLSTPGGIRRGVSKSLILSDEQVATLADCLPAIRDSKCRRESRHHQVREWQLSSTYAEEARVGQTVCRYRVHKPDTT